MEVGNLVVDFPNLGTRHVLADAKEAELVHHRSLFPLQLAQTLGVAGVAGRCFSIVYQFPASRHAPAVLLALVRELREACLEALEQRVGVLMLWNVAEELVG